MNEATQLNLFMINAPPDECVRGRFLQVIPIYREAGPTLGKSRFWPSLPVDFPEPQ